MDDLNKRGLTNSQQEVMDRFTQEFDHNSLLPEEFGVSIVCNDILSRAFLCPGEIEEVVLGNDRLVPIDILRKLYTFRYYFGEDLEEIEKTISSDEISRVLKFMTVGNILEIFKDAGYTSFKNQTRKFVVYFLVIEKWYEEKAGTPLSFSGLSEPNDYNDYLGN